MYKIRGAWVAQGAKASAFSSATQVPHPIHYLADYANSVYVLDALRCAPQATILYSHSQYVC